jgi:hypothetical protein
MPLKVNEQSPEVAAKNDVYTIVEDVLSGTIRMRDKARDYLPQRLREEANDYAKRAKSAVLFGGTRTTLSALVGRAFADPLEIAEPPAWFEPIADNIDSRGKRLGVWAEELFELGLTYGEAWALVDTPPMPQGLSAEAQKGKVPYAVAISARNVLGWVYEGAELVQLRIMWSREEREEFGAKQVPQVRVYNSAPLVKAEGGPTEGGVTLRIYEEKEATKGAKEWQLVEEKSIAVKRIPCIRVELDDKPPLLELAHHEIKLFQRESSADSLIDVVEVPILGIFGQVPGTELVIGASSAISMHQNGKIEFAEHSGAAIQSGREYRQDIKEAMRQIGARFTEPKSANIKTATQSGEESANDNSDLANMVIRFGDAMTDLIDLIAEFAGQAVQGTVKMHPNLKPSLEPQQLMGTVNTLVNAGIVSHETAFGIAKALPLGIPDDLTWEAEKVKIEAAAKAKAALEPKAGGFGA